MTSVSFNPYTWDKSSKAIQSGVASLRLQNGHSNINISNLNEDIVIAIPIFSQQKNTTKVPEHRFLKPNKMTVHSYMAELSDVPVIIEMGLQDTGVVVELFVKFGSRPTIEDFDMNFTMSSIYSCAVDKQNGNETYCFFEKGHVSVVPKKPSILFVGAIGKKKLSRRRRSCFGHGRQKRDCVGVKEAPLKRISKTIVPQYNPLTDVNYTMSITQTGCLYWSEDKEKWSSEGCKVRAYRYFHITMARCSFKQQYQ